MIIPTQPLNSTFLEIPATKIKDIPVHELNKKITDVVDILKPQYVFCPYPDRHIDHRIVFESAMVATRPVGSGKNIEILGGTIIAHFFGSYPLNLPRHAADSAIPTLVHRDATVGGEERRDERYT